MLLRDWIVCPLFREMKKTYLRNHQRRIYRCPRPAPWRWEPDVVLSHPDSRISPDNETNNKIYMYTRYHGWKFKISQILNFWYSKLKTNSMSTKYSKTSMARTGLGPWKIVLAKGSSSHPGWIMHSLPCRDHDDSSRQPRWMSHQSSSHWSSIAITISS